MHWSQLIDTLVRKAGGALAVAKAMGKPTFQGTLHKIASGNVESPSRASAERIATHFGIPVDALYDDALAAQVYEERFGPGSLPEAREALPGGFYKDLSAIIEPSIEIAAPPRSTQPPKTENIVKVLEKLGSIMSSVDPITRSAISPLVCKIIEIPEQTSVIARKVNALIAADIDFERELGKSRALNEGSRKSG